MAAPDSALKLFLKHTPDALEHLFDRCISSLCETEQVQGKIFFDFFLFCPNPGDCQQMDTGEMTLLQILITHGKAYYLIHPLFETFIRVSSLISTPQGLHYPISIAEVAQNLQIIHALCICLKFLEKSFDAFYVKQNQKIKTKRN